MLLSKRVAVSLNLVACQFKQYTASKLRKNGINLTPEQFLVLDLLWNQGEMSQQRIADNMQKDKNSVTKLVDALETKGLVERKKDPMDRRSNTIVLTPKSEAMKMQTKEFGISMLDGMLLGIDDAELTAFLATLDKLTVNMNRR